MPGGMALGRAVCATPPPARVASFEALTTRLAKAPDVDGIRTCSRRGRGPCWRERKNSRGGIFQHFHAARPALGGGAARYRRTAVSPKSPAFSNVAWLVTTAVLARSGVR